MIEVNIDLADTKEPNRNNENSPEKWIEYKFHVEDCFVGLPKTERLADVPVVRDSSAW